MVHKTSKLDVTIAPGSGHGASKPELAITVSILWTYVERVNVMSQHYKGEVKTLGESMARSTTEAQAFKIFMDEPTELGGRNGAPSPLDFILAAHGGCLNFMTFYIAKEMGIPIEGTEITIEGSLDPAKFAGADTGARAGYQSLKANITVKSTASDADIERLKAAVEDRCPVSDNITHATPVEISMRTA